MILCVGLTPTIQRTMRFARLDLGGVNRAAETVTTASGKAVNVARVLYTLGASVHLVQVGGGESGRQFQSMLEHEGLVTDTIDAGIAAPTRTCTTLLFDDGTPTTELVEEAKPLVEDTLHEIQHAINRQLSHARLVICSGSLPPGVPEDFYARLVHDANLLGIRAVVDAQKAPLRAALAQRPFLVKPNREEAAATLGLTLSGASLRDAHTAVDALLESGAEWALVSLGKDGSLLGGRAETTRWQIHAPQIDAVNPIGSGDSLAAGTVYALTHQTTSVPEAAKYGTVCAAANVLTLTSGVVFPDDVARLLPHVAITIARD